MLFLFGEHARNQHLTFNELEKIHEKAARLIYKIPAARDPLSSANWKSLSYIYKRRLSLVMHDIYYENAPKSSCETWSEQIIM